MNGSTRQRPRSRGLQGRAGLALTSALSAMLMVAATMSADARQGGATPANTPENEDSELVYLEADEIFADQETGEYIARGMVEIRYGARTLRADEVTVNPAESRVHARGDITIISDDGIITYAEEAELSGDLSEGIIEGFAGRFPNGGQTGAAFAIRRGGSVTELRRAFYTVCEACESEGRRPTWRIRARRVTQDQDAQMLYYRDAMLEIKGVPVLYAPFFAHADPSSERRSGLMMPTFGESSRTGTHYEQPYYWAISEHQDLTIAPRIMSSANPLVAYEHRRKFFSGGTIFQGSITNEQEFDDDGNKFGERLWRGHIFGEGEFALNETWNWGFSVERVSDDLYFRRYDIDDTDAQRGLYRRGSKRLLSQVFVEGQSENFYTTFSAFAFQGLRGNDDEDLFPVATPFGEYRRHLSNDFFGGRLNGRLSTAFLQRAEGVDSRRITGEIDWRRRFITPGGVVAEPFAFARADVYQINDFTAPSGAQVDDLISRSLGYVGAEISWPFGRRVGGLNLVIEPVGNVVIAPVGGNDERIPNEDSITIDLDEANIFNPNRSPGFDIWEDGLRATVGARAVARWGRSQEASLFLGQSFRSAESIALTPASGLDGDQSDIIGAAEFALSNRRRVSARFRLDEETFDLQRLDLDVRYNFGPASFSGKYLRFGDELSSGRPSEELSFTTGIEVTRNWGAYYRSTLDLDADETRFAFFGLVYNDECARLELIYKRDGTRDRALSSGDSVRLQFTLRSLGTFGRQ